MKRLILSVTALIVAATSMAQSLEDAKKLVYYNKYNSAKAVLEKIVAANPADAKANYWLGQILLETEDVVGAKALYTKALIAAPQDPLLMIGLGHIELLEKKNAEAKAHFDAALAPTKNKKNKNFGEPELLSAIGRANADGGTEYGDAVYGIDRLKEAAQLDLTSADIMINQGITQLKRGGEYGGEAKRAFDEALMREPNNARAYLRIGKIFESQRNTELLLDNYNKAVQVDPTYGPGYLALYTYYQDRDVNKAKEYLDKYIANSDKDLETDFFAADYMFRAGRNQESLAATKKIEEGLNGQPFPKIYKLNAYNYDRLGDSTAALANFEKYMAQEMPSKINGDDYALMSKLYLRVPGNEEKAEITIEKAVAADTSMTNKINYMKQMSAAYALTGNAAGQFKWLDKANQMKPDNSARNLFFMADAAIKAKMYDSAQKIAEQYITAFPDQPQGYNFLKNAAIAADFDTTKGTAIPAIDRQNQYYMTDTAKNKNRIIQNNGYKIYYYLIKAKDYNKALESANAILALDPTNNYGTMAKSEAERLLKGPVPKSSSAEPGKKTPPKPSGGKVPK